MEENLPVEYDFVRLNNPEEWFQQYTFKDICAIPIQDLGQGEHENSPRRILLEG